MNQPLNVIVQGLRNKGSPGAPLNFQIHQSRSYQVTILKALLIHHRASLKKIRSDVPDVHGIFDRKNQ